MNADLLWESLMRASESDSEQIQGNLEALLRSATMPDKFWDRDLIRLKELGAIEIIRRMVSRPRNQVSSQNEFIRAFQRCPEIQR